MINEKVSAEIKNAKVLFVVSWAEFDLVKTRHVTLNEEERILFIKREDLEINSRQKEFLDTYKSYCTLLDIIEVDEDTVVTYLSGIIKSICDQDSKVVFVGSFFLTWDEIINNINGFVKSIVRINELNKRTFIENRSENKKAKQAQEKIDVGDAIQDMMTEENSFEVRPSGKTKKTNETNKDDTDNSSKDESEKEDIDNQTDKSKSEDDKSKEDEKKSPNKNDKEDTEGSKKGDSENEEQRASGKTPPQGKPTRTRKPNNNEPNNNEPETNTDSVSSSNIKAIEKSIFTNVKIEQFIEAEETPLDSHKADTLIAVFERFKEHINSAITNEKELDDDDYSMLMIQLIKSKDVKDFEECKKIFKIKAKITLEPKNYIILKKEAMYYRDMCDLFYTKDMWD